MSHDATNWAIKQRGIKPALKVVLWNLCDRYHPDNGCFPSQETLAEDCEVPRSTLNTYLSELEGLGLILREQRRDKGSKRQQRTRYFFPFEPDFAAKKAEKPSPETGLGSDEAESRNQGEPSPEIGESRVQNLDSNLVREPVREPVSEREGASEREGGQEPQADERAEGRAVIERAFRRFFHGWKTAISDSEHEARREWASLSPDERAAAWERSAEYQAAALSTGRKYLCSAAVYLREKRWEKLPVRQAVQAAPAVEGPFGKGWGALRLAELLKPARALPAIPRLVQQMILDGKIDCEAEERERLGKFGWPAVADMHERASAYRGVIVAPDIKALGAGFVQVRVGGDVFDAWKRLHYARRWPWLPDTGNQQYVYFPALSADVKMDLDDAVSAAMNEFAARLREVRGDEHAA